MIILNERTVILLTRPEVSAVQIKTLANKITLTRTPRATRTEINVNKVETM